jgi:hypothetical protein
VVREGEEKKDQREVEHDVSWPDIADKIGRDMVESVYNRVLLDIVVRWESQQNEFGRLLNTSGFTDEQRRVVWRLLASAVETSFHHFVYWLDDKAEHGELAIRFIDKDKPKTRATGRMCRWGCRLVFLPTCWNATALMRRSCTSST